MVDLIERFSRWLASSVNQDRRVGSQPSRRMFFDKVFRACLGVATVGLAEAVRRPLSAAVRMNCCGLPDCAGYGNYYLYCDPLDTTCIGEGHCWTQTCGGIEGICCDYQCQDEGGMYWCTTFNDQDPPD